MKRECYVLHYDVLRVEIKVMKVVGYDSKEEAVERKEELEEKMKKGEYVPFR